MPRKKQETKLIDFAEKKDEFVKKGEFLSILEQFAKQVDAELGKSIQASVIAFNSVDFILKLLEKKGLVTEEDIQTLVKEMSDFKNSVKEEN